MIPWRFLRGKKVPRHLWCYSVLNATPAQCEHRGLPTSCVCEAVGVWFTMGQLLLHLETSPMTVLVTSEGCHDIEISCLMAN